MRQNLIEARKVKKMTQAQLGILVGLQKQGICALERSRNDTSSARWRKLAEVLGESIERLSAEVNHPMTSALPSISAENWQESRKN